MNTLLVDSSFSFKSPPPIVIFLSHGVVGFRIGHVAMLKKPIKIFDLEVKDKGHIGVMNVHDTSSNGDTHIHQIWYADVEDRKRTYTVRQSISYVPL